MTNRIILLILLFPLLFACQKRKEKVEDIYKEIRKYPQTNNPGNTDKKVVAIKKLIKTNDINTPDSLKAIFHEIDTTYDRYWDLYSVVLNVLLDINTEKSYSTFAEILGNTKIPCPGDYQTYFNKIHDNIKKVKFVFPDLAKGLLTQEWINDNLLILMRRGFDEGYLSKASLTTSEPFLLGFYAQLKIERDSLKGASHWREYYKTELAHLLNCLRIFSDSAVNKIYLEVLQDNSSFVDYANSDSKTDYWNESMPKLWIMRQAVAGLLENNQVVPEQYMDKIMKDPLFRNFVYEDAIAVDKQDKLPSTYLHQSNFAESDLIHSMWDTEDGDIPDKVILLEKRNLQDGLWQGTFYFYEVIFGQYENEISRSIMISGPQPLDPNKFVEKGALTLMFFEHDPDTNNYKKYIDRMMLEVIKKE